MGKEKYLILKGCAGIGNRLLTLKDAIKYAQQTNRTLYVDWADGWHLEKGENSFYQYFDLANVKYVDSIQPILDALYNGATTYPIQLSREEIENDIYSNYYFKQNNVNPYIQRYCYVLNKTCWSYLLSGGYWYKTYNERKNSIHNFFSKFDPRDKFCFGYCLNRAERNEDIVCYADFGTYEPRKGMFDNILINTRFLGRITSFATHHSLSKRIAVHVRATDKKPPQSVKKLIDIIKNDYLPLSNGIFLSTDNPEIEELFIRNFKDLVVSYPKELPTIGTDDVGKADFGGTHHWIRNKDKEQKRQFFEASLADMWLLSMCKYLLWQGNSTFSMISTELMDNKDNIKDWTKLF